MRAVTTPCLTNADVYNAILYVSCQRLFWFHVLLTKQLKCDNAGHWEATINSATTVQPLIARCLIVCI